MLGKKEVARRGPACRLVCDVSCTTVAKGSCSCSKKTSKNTSYNNKWNWAHMLIMSPDTA